MEPLAHASIALMAKPTAPKAPLLALVAATQVPDLLSFGLIAVGVEHGAETHLDFQHGLQYLSQPYVAWSHGLVMCLVASALVAGIAHLIWRERRTSGWRQRRRTEQRIRRIPRTRCTGRRGNCCLMWSSTPG